MLRRGSRSGAEVLRSENDKEEAFAGTAKNPARDLADRAAQLVMVAGVGFVQERTSWELRKVV